MKPLTGWRFAICGPRRAAEIALILDKQGAQGFSSPTIKTVLEDKLIIKTKLESFCAQGADWVIITTGQGLNELKAAAEQYSLWPQVYQHLKQSKLAIRGYKSDKAVSRILLEPILQDQDGTVDSLIEQLQHHNFAGQRVFLQLYGQPSPRLVKFLQQQGAIVDELLPYKHISIGDQALEVLLTQILALEFDAVVFTSIPQVDYLLDYAQRHNKLEELRQVFESIWAVAVGRVTAKPLQQAGIRVWHPEIERMGAMVTEFAQMIKQ